LPICSHRITTKRVAKNSSNSRIAKGLICQRDREQAAADRQQAAIDRQAWQADMGIFAGEERWKQHPQLSFLTPKRKGGDWSVHSNSSNFKLPKAPKSTENYEREKFGF